MYWVGERVDEDGTDSSIRSPGGKGGAVFDLDMFLATSKDLVLIAIDFVA